MIVGGDTEEMQIFLDRNPGLRSRFNKVVMFEDYSPEERLRILNLMAENENYILTDEAKSVAIDFFQFTNY